MQIEVKHPTEYKTEEAWEEAVREARLQSINCPQCLKQLDVQALGESGMLLECVCCGFVNFTTHYRMPKLGNVGSA